MFLFGVGLYGASQRALTRHLAIWGVVPLDLYFLALLIAGVILLFIGAPEVRALVSRDPEHWPPGFWGAIFLGVRTTAACAMLGVLLWFVIKH